MDIPEAGRIQGEAAMADLKALSELVQKGKAKEVEAAVQQALKENMPVKDILEIGERYGVKCAVASGSEMALEKVNAANVDVVIAIACERELAGGIKALFPKKVLAVPNTRPHGPCKDCGVDIKSVEAFLNKTISI